MPAPSGDRSQALLGVLLCVVVWGVNYPATKIAYRELSPLAYTGWRFLLAAALILGVGPYATARPSCPREGCGATASSSP